MRVLTTIDAVRNEIQKARRKNHSIGFVPTMGALHEGHLTLLRRARRKNKLVVMSIFVNPLQFGPKEDFRRYPRPKKKDIFLAKKENVDIIFYPSVKEMYDERFLTGIRVNEITQTLCGASRPGHFDGVATVVGKLLNIVTPDRLYLGQKDAQQCAVIRQMVRDLNFPVEVIVVPTVREKDGLAMSSRNQYLTAQHRREAPVLYQALTAARLQIRKGERRPEKILRTIRSKILEGSSGKIDYVACVDAKTLEPLGQIKGDVLIALAVWFGKARLIDNILVRPK